MTEQYKILFDGGEGVITEKKSRFIATARPAQSEEEALLFIEEMRKKYWDANHNCYAYVIGDLGQVKRCSDDGEPSQTAGKPILDVIVGEDVKNLCVVVTRYFGGTLLGTGGLVRAYSKAAQEGLANSCIVEKCLGKKLVVTSDYNWFGKIKYLAQTEGLTTLDTEYTDQVVFSFLVPVGQADRVCAAITEITNGKCPIEQAETMWYSVIEKKIHIF